MARRIGSSRGWLARARRSSLCFSVATSGSALPVSADCCIAARIAASMSPTRFSSRERDTERTSSSSWPRCSATSPRRASSRATLAVASRIASCAWRASSRASPARSALSCCRLTSSFSLLRTRCSARQASATREHRDNREQDDDRAAQAPEQRAARRRCRHRQRKRRFEARWKARERRSRLHRLYAGDHRFERRVAPRRPRRSRPVAPAPRCADGWRAPAIRDRSPRRRARSRWPIASELLKSHACPAGAAKAASTWCRSPLESRGASRR